VLKENTSLFAWKKNIEIQKEKEDIEVKDATVSENQLQQLRDLGYVQ
jgi:hypothetical protein